MFQSEQQYIQNKLGNEPWIKVHGYFYDENEDREDNIYFHCGIINNDCVQQALDNIRDWEIYQDQGFPGCTRYGLSEESEVVYDRFGGTEAEPLVFIRYYKGFRDPHLEISEEFRLFHNLYDDLEKNELIKFDESGDATSVIRFEKNSVFIRLKEIRQFLAIKEAHLLLFFEYFRSSKIDISDLAGIEKEYQYRDEHTAYSIIVHSHSDSSKYKTDSSIRGDLLKQATLFLEKLISHINQES
ncbi:hypothetical protein [Cyanothece sp. BG0011]|uniref:hypothetical protein n=1 Tax=Cyanothece sp. BG0011 TaxID=2082950 RepID=UPI001E2BB1CF|nr:hypothetical protein [Cyanothece sp. BG0011]